MLADGYFVHGGLIMPRKAMKHEEYRKKLHEINSTIDLVDSYIKSTIPIRFKCLVCGFIWKANPHAVKDHKTGCPLCSKIKKRKTHNAFLEELLKVNPTLDALDLYIGSQHSIRFKCKLCGHIWKARPSHVLYDKTSCPMCTKESMEKLVVDFLINKGVDFKHDVPLEGSNYKGSPKPLRIDFIIETEKGPLAVETDGIQHFIPIYSDEIGFLYQKEKDRYKDKILFERGYTLIRVVSSTVKKIVTDKYITLDKLFELLENSINSNGKLDLDVFHLYDFNRT